MSRTTLYKTHYFGMMVLALAGAMGIIAASGFALIVIIAMFLVLQVPGRVLGYFWRDLLKGLKLLNARQFAESKRWSEKFLREYPEKRWIRHLVWLGSSTYSHNPEVLALNNLGAAELNLGEIVPACTHLKRAIEIDPLCPLPYYNMAQIYRMGGDETEAERWLADASRLGLGINLGDKIVRSSQTRFANRSGH